VLGTYASVVAVCAASLLIGQAAIALCGRREWSWSSPAVGLALLCALCWATVRMPGDGVISAVAVLVASLAATAYLRGRLEGGRAALAAGAPVALIALAAASLPFLAEGHFGILGTSFNPDMSQHLLAADRLAHGQSSPLLHQGYPLGPHAIVVALNKGLGAGIVQGFTGLTVAVPVLASLTALGALRGLAPWRRTIGAVLVGIPYMVASYFAQGAFKETMEALFVLAFAIGLLGLARAAPEERVAWRESPLRAVPLALIAAGSVYAYSFPGLSWLALTAALWGLLELLRSAAVPRELARGGVRPAALALLVLAVLTAPEIGRMVDFHSFETFDPNGPGLGNLFGQISPFEALGIWPSGDFRLTPGDGAVPAFGYYAGVALGLVLLLVGLRWAWRRGDNAIPAALAAAVGLYAAARIGGTPYTAAKAVAMISPVAMLLIVRPLLALPPGRPEPSLSGILAPLAAAGFLVAAAACSALALANAPVGPTTYSPALTELRPLIAPSSTLVVAPPDLLTEQHGVPYLQWELRGGRVCIESAGGSGGVVPHGARFVLAPAGSGAPFTGLRRLRRAGAFEVWERRAPVPGPGSCPLIAVRQARQGPG
jgi:hypothetical protein